MFRRKLCVFRLVESCLRVSPGSSSISNWLDVPLGYFCEVKLAICELLQQVVPVTSEHDREQRDKKLQLTGNVARRAVTRTLAAPSTHLWGACQLGLSAVMLNINVHGTRSIVTLSGDTELQSKVYIVLRATVSDSTKRSLTASRDGTLLNLTRHEIRVINPSFGASEAPLVRRQVILSDQRSSVGGATIQCPSQRPTGSSSCDTKGHVMVPPFHDSSVPFPRAQDCSAGCNIMLYPIKARKGYCDVNHERCLCDTSRGHPEPVSEAIHHSMRPSPRLSASGINAAG